MLRSLILVAEDMFYGPALMVLALALALLQVAVLVLVLRQRKRGKPPSMKLHAIAGAAIAPLPVLIAVSVHTARATMIAAINDVAPSHKAMALSRGISGQINGIAFAVFATGLALLLWVVGFAYSASAPGADGRARPLPPAALVGVGLLPTALGALLWATGLVKSSAGVAGVDPSQKEAFYLAALDAARAELAHYARISTIAIPLLAVVAIVLIVTRDRGRSRAEPARPPSARRSLIASGAALLLAALLVHQARPFVAENALPWPNIEGMWVEFPQSLPMPPLTGPDPMDRAPVVQVQKNDLGLDGARELTLEDLRDKLITLRNNYRLLHPGEDFNGLALIVAGVDTPMPQLFSAASAIHHADYHQLLFAFTRPVKVVRPVLGTVNRSYTTGALTGVFYSDWLDKWGDPDEDAVPWKNADAVALRSQDFSDYTAFARRLVELRRQGKKVAVLVDRDAP